jgi:hypothetical protein
VSDAEREALERLRIGRAERYDNYGNIRALESEVGTLITSLGTDGVAARHIGQLVGRLAGEVVSVFNAETAWVALRMSLPNNLFDIPRWHIDGYFFRPFSGDQQKVVVALKGPGTLFAHLTRKWREVFLECAQRHQRTALALEGREELRQIVEAGGAVKATRAMEGTIFTVGCHESATIHSEPKISSERMFLSLVPGSMEQINALRERWKAPLQAKG